MTDIPYDPEHDAIWTCSIGFVERDTLPEWADSPMRKAVKDAFYGLTGSEAIFTSSGWGSRFDEETKPFSTSEGEVMTAPFDQDVELKQSKIDTIRLDLVAFALAVVALVLSLVGIVLAAVAL